MIKIIFLLTLIYFTYCAECSNYNNPQNAKVCLSLQTEDGKKCCFVDILCRGDVNRQIKICSEENKNDDSQTITQLFESEDSGICDSPKVNVLVCEENELNNSCYLKIGILLILGLLF